MSPRRKWRSPCCALAIAACALLAPGCASWQGPRIDPSGQQILIWPGQTPPPVAPPPGVAQPQIVVPAPGTTVVSPALTAPTPPPPVITTPPPPPPAVGLPTGNLQAPPVYPDAGVPSAPPQVITLPPPPSTGAPPVTTVPTAAAPALPPPPSIDAQFAFPAPTIAQAGHPLILTTLVTRRSDKVPLSGWTVRYEVASSGAALGGTGGNRVEVPTDASGRASIEISPASTAPGEAVVSMVAIAPPEITTGPIPTAEVARGTATISWRQGVPGAPAWAPQPQLLSGSMPAPSLAGPPLTGSSVPEPEPSTLPYSDTRTPNRFEPPPSLADRDTTPKTYAPPPAPRQQPPAGKPELSVEVRRRGAGPVDVEGFASFDVIVTNRGNETARHIKVHDRFDEGLTHIRALPGEREVKHESINDLAPGNSVTVPLTFGVKAAGELCHEVTVTADGANPVTERGCITAVAAKPAGQPTIEVTKQGPRRHYVGELALFSIVIKNTGEVFVTNLVVNDRYDAALEPRSTGAGATRLADDSFEWRIPRLEKGERREIKVSAACVSPSTKACSTATVTADGGIMITEERCVEILPSQSQLPAGPGGVSPPPALPAESLKVTLQSTANPARVGTPASLYVFVENVGQKTEQSVALRVQMPPETPPIAAQIKPAGASEMYGALEVRFNNVGNLAPGERREFEIPYTPGAARVVTFNAQVTAAGMAQPINTESNSIQIEAAAQ
ncbi:MAG: hypothetical protein AB7G28_07450 [Pirellulales bacterium]